MGSRTESLDVVRKLDGKVALITGGASGVGECTARLFCLHGAKVVIADIKDELGEALCNELRPPAASFIHCDVTNEDHINRAIDHAITKFGKLDILFNNAGIWGSNSQDILHTEKAEFERVLGVNLVGSFLGTKHAARVMIPARQGVIVNMSSVAAVIGGVASHAYTCSKKAVVALTTNTATELGRFGIRVNCISPAGVSTPVTTSCAGLSEEFLEEAMGRVAKLKGVMFREEDIANAVLYLASDDSRYVSGHNLVVDGGFSIVHPPFEDFMGFGGEEK